MPVPDFSKIKLDLSLRPQVAVRKDSFGDNQPISDVKTAEGIAASYGAKATVSYRRLYPPVVNHAKETDFAAKVARSVAGDAHVNADAKPLMGSEDFSFMLNERPGNMIMIGNGDTTNCHHPAYNFDDATIPAGVSYWARLIEMGMPAK